MKIIPTIKMDELPNPEEIYILHGTRPIKNDYIDSLIYALNFKVERICGRVYSSRSGLSKWVEKLYIKAGTNRHTHELFIIEGYIEYEDDRYTHTIPIAIADWYVDGEEVGVIILPRYILSKLNGIVATLTKAGVINNGEFDVEFEHFKFIGIGDWY